MTSVTFATVICDADEPFSENTAKEPESTFTMSPRNTTLPFYFWYWGSNSAFLEWQMSINVAKWIVLCFFCAPWMTFLLLFTLAIRHAGIFRASPTLRPLMLWCPRCSFLGAKDKNCAQECDGSTNWTPCRQCDLHDLWVETLSKRFLVDSWPSTTHACFAFPTNFPVLVVLDLPKNSCFQCPFQLFCGLFQVFLWTQRVPSGSIKEMPLNFRALSTFWFLDKPLLLLTFWTNFDHKGPGLVVACIFDSRTSDHMFPSGNFSFQIVNCAKTVPFGIWEVLHQCTKWNNSSFERFTILRQYGVFPSVRKSWPFRR